MAEWIVTPPADPRAFPVVRHAHPNGTLPVDRQRTPTVVQGLGGPRVERWEYRCACGEVWSWEPPGDELIATRGAPSIIMVRPRSSARHRWAIRGLGESRE
jgi:hypothetical protein